jgi:pyruvyl transferase EpsI
MSMQYWKKSIKYQLIRRKIIRNNPFQKTKEIVEDIKPVVYLFYVACGTNMGDHAIVRAETEFIQKCLGGNVNIVEIQTGQTEAALVYLKKNIRKQDLIILSGGGYIGDEYIEIYSPLKKILRVFKEYKMIIFPQTIYFSNVRNESKFAQLCRNHSCLEIFVREEKSCDIFNKIGINVHLVPDIVLSQIPQKHNKKNDILLCMRNDVEKRISNAQVQQIYTLLQEYGSVTVTDTVETEIFPIEQRFLFLDKMLNKFSNSKFVVTDRIHGMIFAYLTNTPCLVFGNYNHKVESEYQWIKGCGNIKFMESFDKDDLKKSIAEILALSDSNNKTYIDKFIKLEEVLRAYYE